MRKNYYVRIQQAAVDALDAIYRFVFQGSAVQARAFVKALQKKIISLKDYPRRGSRVPLLEDASTNSEIRFIEFKGYLIYYTIIAQDVFVLHIAGPGQDLMELFAG